ncbi:MAG TPA: hypothetical protein DCL41_09520 [Bdellovibrionales bacterium]|nr:hypothetical protein [Pseudobdellovibrionaceae bacterium]HAG92100.1 hypothetical protein [Bdellovibrionales bacterium]
MARGGAQAVYLTYDEPLKEERWQTLQKYVPQAIRVDGVEGFDRAHKACLDATTGRRLVIIDGDNELQRAFFKERIPNDLWNSNYVLSWPAVNSINGLIYGNGGIKCWDRDVLENFDSHENAKTKTAALDFCFDTPYYQMETPLSISRVDLTPYQSFRAGFREGVKLGLDRGELVRGKLSESFPKTIAKSNLFRLKTWCSVGADIRNGPFAILGARLGLVELYRNESMDWIRDYRQFENYWTSRISPQIFGEDQVCYLTNFSWSQEKLSFWIEELDDLINAQFGLDIACLSADESRNFKRNMINPKRKGLMFKEFAHV